MTPPLLLVGLLLAPAPPRPLTVAEFAARIHALSTIVAAADAPAAQRLASTMPVSEHVVEAGEAFDVPLGWLRDALARPEADARGWPVIRHELVDRLRLVEREADAFTARRLADSRPREVLTAVLAQKSFQRVRTASWQADLRRRIGEWLADIWAKTVGGRVAQRRVAQILAWVASGAAILVLLVWLLRLASRLRAERPITVGPIDVGKPGYVLGLEAAALIHAGQLREGARAAYRAGLRRLEEEGAFRPDAAKTPREYVGLLPRAHRRRSALSALTATFERIWYGSRPAGPDEGMKLLSILQELECLPSDRAK